MATNTEITAVDPNSRLFNAQIADIAPRAENLKSFDFFCLVVIALSRTKATNEGKKKRTVQDGRDARFSALGTSAEAARRSADTPSNPRDRGI